MYYINKIGTLTNNVISSMKHGTILELLIFKNWDVIVGINLSKVTRCRSTNYRDNKLTIIISVISAASIILRSNYNKIINNIFKLTGAKIIDLIFKPVSSIRSPQQDHIVGDGFYNKKPDDMFRNNTDSLLGNELKNDLCKNNEPCSNLSLKNALELLRKEMFINA